MRLVFSALIAGVLLAGAALPASSRAFQVLVFLGLLAALWSAGDRLARWLVPDWQPLSRAVAAFTFAVGIAGVPATWMGHFGVLRPAVFLAWTAAAFLLSRFLPAPANSEKTNQETSVRSVPSVRSVRIETALLLTAALTIALTGAREIRGQRYLPPKLYDDLSYHLSTVATWVRHGDLRMVRFSMGDSSTPFYPVLGEVTSWVLIAPFRDSDVAARWTQLPFAILSFLAAAAIARNLGLARRDAALAAISYAGIHHVFPFIAMGAGNDHATSYFTLAAVDGALCLARRPRAGAAVVTGSALGLLLATKYIGVFFAPVILAVLVLAVIAERRREGGERTPARTLAGLAVLLAAVMAVTGSYTYLRNAATTGNPLFPAPVRTFGFEVFPGWQGITPAWRDTSPEAQIDVWHFLTRRTRLFGSYFPFTLLLAAVVAPLLALARRRWREALAFSLPAVFFLQFLFLMHDHRDNRYFLPGIALASVAFAWLLAQAGRRAVPIRAALLLWISWQIVRDFRWTMTSRVLTALALLLAGALLEMAWQRWRTREGRPLRSRVEPWWRVAVAGLLALSAMPLGAMVARYQKVKLAHEPAALALERLAGPDGARVAYAGLNKPYLFFGSRLQNALEIVPRNRALAARTYRWGSQLGEPYDEIGRYRQWRGNVERLKIEYVVVIRTPWEDPERRWVAHRTQDFQLAYADDVTEIWKVLPGRAAARRHGAADRPAPRRRAAAGAWKPGGRSGSRSSSRSSPDRDRSHR
jgi:hypothetical protein